MNGKDFMLLEPEPNIRVLIVTTLEAADFGACHAPVVVVGICNLAFFACRRVTELREIDTGAVIDAIGEAIFEMRFEI